MNNRITSLKKSKDSHNNDYYTRLEWVNNAIEPFKSFISGIVYCPCDDYRISNFVKYFKDNFNDLNLKELIATNYDVGNGAYLYSFNGKEEKIEKLNDNGDFLSNKRNELYEKCDHIITNPPFTMDVFNPFFDKLMYYHNNFGKNFLIFGSATSTYKKPFKYLKNKQCFCTVDEMTKRPFDLRDGSVVKVGYVVFETYVIPKPRLIPYKEFKDVTYEKYDNYDAINVNKFIDVPKDYNGLIGVPSTAIAHCVANGYEIIDSLSNLTIKGKNVFERLIIKK